MPRRLRVSLALLISVGFGALIVVTPLLPVDPRIGIALPDPAHLSPIAVGLAFWIVLALVGSSFALERPQAFVVTLDLSFIVAATVLGGPVAGGWVAMVGSTELSEIPGTASVHLGRRFARRRSVPWYGVLVNHAVPTFAAVVSGLALMAVEPSLDAASGLGAASRDLIRIVLVATIFVGLLDGLNFEMMAQRSGRSLAEVAREFGFGYRATLAAEAIVAWLMVEIFVPVGWWGAALCVVAIAAIYNGLDVNDAVLQGKVDALTGLWNRAEFTRRIGQLLNGRGQRGRRLAVMWMELKDLEMTNRRYGHEAGDEVLRVVAQRIRRALRPADDPARLEAGAFGVLLVFRDGDQGARRGAQTAEEIAMRLHAVVMTEFVNRGEPVEIRGSIGVALTAPGGGHATVEALMAHAISAYRRAELTGQPVLVAELPD
jgi:diguanylate cyclase (GGDEF)-like protein